MAKWMTPWFETDDLDDFWNDSWLKKNGNLIGVPLVDVYEKDGKMIAQFEVPGVDEKDIDVEITDKTVTVKGRVDEKKEIKEKKYYKMESKMTSFSRCVAWPVLVDSANAEATIQDGVLKIVAPKSSKEKSATKLKVKKVANK